MTGSNIKLNYCPARYSVFRIPSDKLSILYRLGTVGEDVGVYRGQAAFQLRSSLCERYLSCLILTLSH